MLNKDLGFLVQKSKKKTRKKFFFSFFLIFQYENKLGNMKEIKIVLYYYYVVVVAVVSGIFQYYL